MAQGRESKGKDSEPQRFTRREFLKDAGLIIGGAAVSHVALSAACSAPQATTTAATPPVTTVSSTAATTTTKPPTTTPRTTITSQTATTKATTTAPLTSPTASGDIYVPPTEPPPLELTPNCTTYVAFDRRYSIEHIWVKDLGEGRAVMGITDKLQALSDTITSLALPLPGDTLVIGTSFGESEGFKMNVDLITPVSGLVLQINEDLRANLGLLNTDPFVKGWMIYMELTKPEELNDMLSPAEYMALQAKDAPTEH